MTDHSDPFFSNAPDPAYVDPDQTNKDPDQTNKDPDQANKDPDPTNMDLGYNIWIGSDQVQSSIADCDYNNQNPEPEISGITIPIRIQF